MASPVDVILAAVATATNATNETEAITADLANNGFIPRKATKAKFVVSDANSKGTSGNAFYKFILESVGIAMNCKYQLTETFTSGFFTAFGHRPTFMNISGTLLDSENYSWLDDMIISYKDMLNASSIVANDKTMRLMYDNKIMEVLMLSLNVNQSSGAVLQAKFSSQLLIVGNIQFLGDK